MQKIYGVFLINIIIAFCSLGISQEIDKDNLSVNDLEVLSKENDNINVLLIADDSYGISFIVGNDEIKSIKQQFEDFGWIITIAGIKDTINPCEWGKSTFGTIPIIIDTNLLDNINPENYSAIVILPGRSMANLITNSETLNLLKKANQEGMIIAAWCRGVRLLAAADIIRGKKVIGHFDYFDEYKAAGANYIEYSFKWYNGTKQFNNVTPPIRDGNIITTVRSLYYRNEMCQLIRIAVEENRKLQN